MTLKRPTFRTDNSIIHAIWCVFLLPAWAHAATLTVKSGGGGNYTTIQACATAMSNGDTCRVYAGTYNEDVTVPAGGIGAYKTLTVNGSDVVTVNSFTLNSHNKLIGNCTLGAAINTCGFNIQNLSSPSNAACVSLVANSTDYYIVNNVMYACGSGYMIKESANANTTYGYIQGNTLSYGCSTTSAPNVCAAMQIVGDHHLIENNDMSHLSDGPYAYGKWLVFRGNKFHDMVDTDCGSNSGNCHIDFSQHDSNPAPPVGTGGALPTEYLLFEGNSVYNMSTTSAVSGSGMHAGPLFQAENCNGACFNAIIRYHMAYHIGGGGITDDNSFVTPPTTSSPVAWINVKAYNNDWIDMLQGQVAVSGSGVNGHSHGSFGGSNVNEIYYFVGMVNNLNPYYCTDTACTPYAYGHNLVYATGGGQILAHNYGSSALFAADQGNLVADPQFLNYAENDFHLSANSPGLASGTYLATVAAGDTGSGTSLVVNDAAYFQDGWGLAGVNGDCVSVTTVGNHVCITAINYSTNTLTLSSAITRSAGDRVWLYSDSTGRQVLVGSAPNIGATFSSAPLSQTPLAPPTVSAVAH